MKRKKNEPKDTESLWLKFRFVTLSLLMFGRLAYDFVKLFIER